MASRRRDRRQARDEAALRYQPEADALTAILTGLKGDLKSGTVQARRAARMLGRSARAGVPTVSGAYDQAISSATAQRAASDAALAKLGPGAEAYKTAAAYDLGSRVPLGSSKAAAVQELVSRAAEAPVRGLEEVRALRGQYASDASKVLGQLTSNAKSAGLYASTRYGELRGDSAKTRNENKQKARDRAQRDRASKRSAGIDPKTGKPIPGGKLDPKTNAPKKWASPAEQNKAQDQIGEAVKQAKKMKAAGRSRAEIGDILVTGRPTQSLKDDKGNTVKVPAIPSYSEIYASTALDLVYGKAISRGNVSKLHKRGIKVRALGYPTGSPTRPTVTRPPNAPGSNGQLRPT